MSSFFRKGQHNLLYTLSYTATSSLYTVMFSLYTVVFLSYTVMFSSYTVMFSSYTVMFSSYTVKFSSYTVIFSSYTNVSYSLISSTDSYTMSSDAFRIVSSLITDASLLKHFNSYQWTFLQYTFHSLYFIFLLNTQKWIASSLPSAVAEAGSWQWRIRIADCHLRICLSQPHLPT